MSKTNWTKVEESLNEGLHRMKVERLNQEAEDLAKLKKNADAAKGTQEVETGSPKAKEEELTPERRQKIKQLQLALAWLKRKDKDLFTHLKFPKEKILDMIQNPDQLRGTDWTRLEMVLKRAEARKAQILEDQGVDDDEVLIEQQRQRHLKKRFNVNEKWLPLK